MAAPAAYGSSQATDQTGATATDHSHTGSKLCSLRQSQILNPLSKAKDRTRILRSTMSGSLPAEAQWELLL